VRHCFSYLIFISSDTVRCKVRDRVLGFGFKVSCRVRFNNSHMSLKSRTASYLAMRHIWHDTGTDLIYSGLDMVQIQYQDLF